MVQDPKKSFRNFVNRFSREDLSIPNLNMTIATGAFKMGLKKDSPFYEDLVMNPWKRMDKFRSRALRFTRLEEDKEIQKRSNPPSSYDLPNRKADSSAQRSYKSKPYSKPGHHKLNALEDEGEEEDFPRITDYCFFVDISGMIYKKKWKNFLKQE